jgi:hypothetical protein
MTGTSRPDQPAFQAIIERYKADVDRTLIRENLKLTPEDRIRKMWRLQALRHELQRAGRAKRR